MKIIRNNTFATPLLGAVIVVVATAMVAYDQTGWLEAASFITGAVCVWLTVKQNVWNFPIGLINVSTFAVVFFHAHLYADASLQIVYFFMGVRGWYLWLYGGQQQTQLRVSRASTPELVMLITFVVVATSCLWQLLHEWGGSASFWDALTTAISLAAQWLLNHKKLESWFFWIVVDVIYIPLYVYKELYLTAILYATFLMMAVVGFQVWRRNWRLQSVNDLNEGRPCR